MFSDGTRVKGKICWLWSRGAFLYAILLGSAWARRRGMGCQLHLSAAAEQSSLPLLAAPAHSFCFHSPDFQLLFERKNYIQPQVNLGRERRASKHMPLGNHIVPSFWFLLHMLRDKHGSKYAFLFSSLNVLLELVRSCPFLTHAVPLFRVWEWLSRPHSLLCWRWLSPQ